MTLPIIFWKFICAISYLDKVITLNYQKQLIMFKRYAKQKK